MANPESMPVGAQLGRDYLVPDIVSVWGDDELLESL
jgi:hypothetical protein